MAESAEHLLGTKLFFLNHMLEKWINQVIFLPHNLLFVYGRKNRVHETHTLAKYLAQAGSLHYEIRTQRVRLELSYCKVMSKQYWRTYCWDKIVIAHSNF
jgi:hypothetical protein